VFNNFPQFGVLLNHGDKLLHTNNDLQNFPTPYYLYIYGW